MQRRLRDLARAEALAADIHAPLAERARAAKRTAASGRPRSCARRISSRAHDVDNFRAAVDAAQRRHRELSFACTGPWPPYSFAALEHEGAAA